MKVNKYTNFWENKKMRLLSLVHGIITILQENLLISATC